MKKACAILILLMVLCTTIPTLAVAEEEFDWRAYEGTQLQVMFNQHNYQKAITDYGKIEEFEELTGIDVVYSVTPEENYFDKLNIALSSQSGEPDIFMTGALSGLGVCFRRIYGAAGRLHQRSVEDVLRIQL